MGVFYADVCDGHFCALSNIEIGWLGGCCMSCLSRWAFFTQTPVHRFAVLGVVETMPLAPAMTSEARDDNTENNWSCNCVRTKNRANKSQATLMAPSMPTASFFMQTPVQVGDAKEASQKRPWAPKCTRTRPELPCIKHETDCIKLLIIRDNPSPWISNGIPEPGWEFPIS